MRQKQKKWHDNLYQFFVYDLWKTPIDQLSGKRKKIHKICRSFLIAFHGFICNSFFLRASSLTYYTLMSIVPTLVMLLAIAKGFGLQKHVSEQLLERFPEQKPIFQKIIALAGNWLAQSHEGLITLIGIIILVWSVIKVMSNIEASLNFIWRIKKSRNWIRKFTDFLSIIIIGPLFFFTANSITLLVVKKLYVVVSDEQIHPVIGQTTLFFVKLIPFALLWFLFSLIYLVMPNTKVNVKAAAFGGIIAGTFFQLIQWVYLYFQVELTQYGTLYGSFAALPLFLAWLQVSWLIILFGAQFSYAYQNIYAFEYGWQKPVLNMRTRVLVSLWIMHKILHAFAEKKRCTKRELQKKLHLPMTLIDELVEDLIQVKLIVAIKEGPYTYFPLITPDELRINDVKNILMTKDQTVLLHKDHVIRSLDKTLHHFEREIEKSSKKQSAF
jgi:membrane protein